MSSNVKKYIGLDVHKDATSIAVLNGAGKLVMESIVETQAATLLEFLHGLRGELHVTLEEGTWAAWLYDVLKPLVEEIVVCNPRRNALLKEGSKSDKVDARKLIVCTNPGPDLHPSAPGPKGAGRHREQIRPSTQPTASRSCARSCSISPANRPSSASAAPNARTTLPSGRAPVTTHASIQTAASPSRRRRTHPRARPFYISLQL